MAEPESNSITSEELASRVRRVVGRRFRRDPATHTVPTTPSIAPQIRNWMAQGYDLIIISLAIFIVSVLVLNLSIAGSWRERGNQWSDRARWQHELHAWEQQLAKQEQQLESECQHLATTLIASHGPAEQQQTLAQVSEIRQRLRDANQSLAAIRVGNGNPQYATRNSNNDSAGLSIAAITAKRNQLIEQQYAARSQFNSEHPALQAIEVQLQELERQLASAQEISRSEYSSEPASRVQVIENQYLRTASNAPPARPENDSTAATAQVQMLEQRFEQLRSATERFLRDVDDHQQDLQQSDIARATAWEQVANALRSMTRACAMPVGLKQAVEKQDQLRTEPSLTPLSLILGLVLSVAVAGAIVWHANISSVIKTTASPQTSTDEQLTINVVTKQLGCAPGAIVRWEMPVVETATEVPAVPSIEPTGKPFQQKIRLASECLLATTIAVTVLLTLTHGQFGDWLIANPLTAWGRWLGS